MVKLLKEKDILKLKKICKDKRFKEIKELIYFKGFSDKSIYKILNYYNIEYLTNRVMKQKRIEYIKKYGKNKTAREILKHELFKKLSISHFYGFCKSNNLEYKQIINHKKNAKTYEERIEFAKQEIKKNSIGNTHRKLVEKFGCGIDMNLLRKMKRKIKVYDFVV